MTKNNILYSVFVKHEKKFRGWIVVKKHQYQLLLFILLAFLLLIVSSAPYVNLVVSRMFLVFLILVLAFIIFEVSPKRIIFLGLSLFIPTLPILLLREFEAAELLGNYIYGILFLGVVLYILKSENS